MGKQKTHKEYVQDLLVKNPNVVVVGEYVNAKTAIEHKCLIDNYVWSIKPTNALKGQGCPLCKLRKISEKLTKTHEQYVLECKEKHPDIEVIGTYTASKTAILHKCKIDGYIWSAIPSNVLSGTGCPRCANNIKYTQQEYIELLAKNNANVCVVGEYIDMRTPISHFCKKHNIYWDTAPQRVLQGGGCSECCKEKIGDKNRKTHEQYVSDLCSIRDDVEVLGIYVDAKTPILHTCKIHNVNWMARPIDVLQGKGCYQCKSTKISIALKKDNLWYVEKLETDKPHITAVEEYQDYDTPILHYCSIHNYEWTASPRNVMRNVGCPKCTGYKHEMIISDWLDTFNISYISQYRFNDCKDIRTLPFDFYLPDYNMCIEYDGRQHFIPIDFAGKGDAWAKEQLAITQHHDTIKTTYCKANNIPLLRISYLQNIEEELEKFLFI